MDTFLRALFILLCALLVVMLLGISLSEGVDLFYGHWSPTIESGEHDLSDITREETIAYLDKCIAAGKIVRTWE